MKKIISQWKWDKLFEECEKSLGQKDTKGNLILSPEEESEWLKRIDENNENRKNMNNDVQKKHTLQII